jgi:hypothetical protein
MIKVTLINPPSTVLEFPDATEIKVTNGVLLFLKPGAGAISGAVTLGLIPMCNVLHAAIVAPAAPPAA